MRLNMDHTTIAAIATPTGSGGVGIIKISGPDALKAAASIFSPGRYDKTKPPLPVKDPAFFSPWRIHYGYITDTDQNRVCDEAIVAVMPAPKSYTREDVVEIQAHGGTVILEGILSLLIQKGIRHAEPGEFTRRAFLNGRIDLAQAEAVIDLINARSEAAVDVAFDLASGKLSDSIEAIRSEVTGVLSVIEAMVDFPDDVEEDSDLSALSDKIMGGILHRVTALISAYEDSKSLTEGVRVVIAGAPNVGKSSLLNRLAGSDRAIVTEHPGTTRDYIEITLPSGSVPVTLVDTAGLRKDPDPVEAMGIEKTHQHIQAADLVLFVLDASTSRSKEDLSFFEEIKNKTVFVILKKIDLVPPGKKPEIPAPLSAAERLIQTSAKHHTGIDELKKKIAAAALTRYGLKPEKPAPNFRHKSLLVEAADALRQAADSLTGTGAPELASIDLCQAYDRLGEITGNKASPEVLDEIFSRYCIGK